MSEVWCATDIELDRRVALKLLGPSADVERFEREARAFAALAHPNVTQLYDYGEDGDRPYMVLEYVPGGTLEDRLGKGGPLPDAETRAIATDIASGLAHAHARGVVHRDLKPANILFDEEGRAKLADFGIAVSAGDGTLTEEGTVLGTAAYISPEQAHGAAVTPASDVYSFGVMFFRMLTGQPPFESADPLELVMLHRDAEAPAVETLRPAAPPELAALTAAALAKDPRRRPPDGATLLAALDEEAATDVTRVMAPPPRPRQRRRSPALMLALLLLLALGGAALAYGITRPSGAASTPPTTNPAMPFTPSSTSTSTPSTSASTSTSTSTSTSLPTTTQPATTIRATTVHTTTVHTTTAPPPTTTAPPPPPTTTMPTTTVPTTTGP